jgi:ABC-type amino acid transport substrate-binding protein
MWNRRSRTLIEDLTTDRCDIAMHAVAVLPAAHAEKLRFSRPYLQSDIYGITTRTHRGAQTFDDIDKPGVQVAVQAGTFMEPVMAASAEAGQTGGGEAAGRARAGAAKPAAWTCS